MRILHVISNLEVGGAEKMLIAIANASVKAGHTVGVCLLVSRGPLISQLDVRVKVHELRRQWRFDWKALRALAILASQYDLLHVHLKHNVKYVYVVNLFFGIPVPVLLHDHSAEVLVVGVPKTKLPYFVVRWLRKQYYLAVSEQLLQWAVVNFRLCQGRAHWLGNAIECGPVPESTAHGKPERVKLLLISNFRRIKNIEFAIALVDEMIRDKMDVTLDIIGKPQDHEYYLEIINKIQALGLSEKIVIRTDVSDVCRIIPDYTLGIHCSRAETGPLVLLEFMCCELPFLAYLSGEVSFHVRNYYPELFINDFSIKNWIERIKYLAPTMNLYRKRLKPFVEAEYSFDRYFSKLYEFYRRLV